MLTLKCHNTEVVELTELAKYFCTAFGSSEFLNIYIFNQYKALYSALSSTLCRLDFIRVIR